MNNQTMIKKRILICFIFFIYCCGTLHAQGRTIYTVVEAGGMFGINKQNSLGNDQSLNGYKFHLMIGRNFNDKLSVGFGLGNEVYKAGKSDMPFSTRFSMLPFLADVRVPISRHFLSGSLRFVGNAGYAPRIGNDMFKGASALGGISYHHPLSFNGPDLLFTLGYGFQQIVLPYQPNNLQLHSASLTVGLFIN